MKILHIFDHSIPLHSGYTFRSRAILLGQRAVGLHTIHVTSTKHEETEADTEAVDGLVFYRTRKQGGVLESLPIVNQWAVVTATERRLKDIIEHERPDILHAHSPSLNGLAAIRVGRKAHLPVIYECRAFWEDAAVDHGTIKPWGPRYLLTRMLETYVFQKAHGITVICQGLRQDILKRGIPAEKVTVIPNAVNLSDFSTQLQYDACLAGRLGLEGRMVLGFVGSFYHYEGLQLLVESLTAIQRKLPDVHLLLVGGGPEEQRLREKVGELGLNDSVTFTGRVPHAEVSHYYNLVDLFIYPRLPMRLTDLVTPLKPLEALAQGRLVIASDVGGHRELIRDGETGKLFTAGDRESLAQAAVEMLTSKEKGRFRKAGRAFVENERCWSHSVQRYHSVYQRVLEERL